MSEDDVILELQGIGSVKFPATVTAREIADAVKQLHKENGLQPMSALATSIERMAPAEKTMHPLDVATLSVISTLLLVAMGLAVEKRLPLRAWLCALKWRSVGVLCCALALGSSVVFAPWQINCTDGRGHIVESVNAYAPLPSPPKGQYPSCRVTLNTHVLISEWVAISMASTFFFFSRRVTTP